MSGANKRLLPDDIKKLKRLQRRYFLKLGRSILLCAIFLGLFILGYANMVAYEQSVIHTKFLLAGTIPTPILLMKPKRAETDLVAIVAHGFPGSKEHMIRLGIELARAGITSYLFDFPGYGESPALITKAQFPQDIRRENATTLAEVVDYARDHHERSKHPSILLIGYSTGSIAVSDYLETHKTEHDIASSVLLSPIDQSVFAAGVSTNLLILTGTYDPFASVANKIFQQSCQQSIIRRENGMDCENFVNSTKLREVILPFLDNSMLPLSQSTFQAIFVWVQHFYPQITETTTIWRDLYLCWLLLETIGAFLAMFPLCSLLVDIFAIHAIPRVFWRWNALFLGLSLLVSMTMSFIVFLGLWYSPFIHLSSVDTIVGYLFCITIISMLFMVLTRRFFPFPLFRQVSRQILAGILVTIFLYFTLGQIIYSSWNFPSTTKTVLWHSGILFVLLWPICFFYEGVTRSWREYGTSDRARYAWLLRDTFKVFFLIALFLILPFFPEIGYLRSLWFIVLVLFLFLEGCCSQFYKRGRATIAGATMSAIVLAYALSILFPLLS